MPAGISGKAREPEGMRGWIVRSVYVSSSFSSLGLLLTDDLDWVVCSDEGVEGS